jgi:hypothetical protein
MSLAIGGLIAVVVDVLVLAVKLKVDTSGISAKHWEMQAGYVTNGISSYQIPYSSYNPSE